MQYQKLPGNQTIAIIFLLVHTVEANIRALKPAVKLLVSVLVWDANSTLDTFLIIRYSDMELNTGLSQLQSS